MNLKNALHPKTMLKDRYQIREVLGQNGLSITYKAFDTFREMNCVVKELYPSTIVTRAFPDRIRVEIIQLSNEELYRQMVERVIRQAKILIKLFPLEGISNIITYFEENSTVYVVSEYIEGHPLSDYLKHRKMEKFELASILNFFSPMTESLKKLHEEGVFHGKIRPENIIITKKNGVKLVGFADPMQDIVNPVFLEELVDARHDKYSSVELFMEGGVLSASTDVYGLTATIYHCITRREPVSFYDRIGKKDRMPSPLDLKVEITDKQSEAIMKGLASHDFERFQTIDELLDAIWAGADEYKEVKPIVLYQPPFAFMQKQQSRRRVYVAGICVAVILLAMIIPGIGRFVTGVRVNSFYKKFDKASLYKQCESLKWLSKADRKAFTNDYSQLGDGEQLETVYYDLRNKKLIDREAFANKGMLYDMIEISYRENNLAIVAFYDRETTRTLTIDLNNLGEDYQVTERVEELGKKTITRKIQVNEETEK